jgi:hypothetical protein
MDSISKTFHTQISQANSILILLPKDPYLDQVAAGLSLFSALRDKKDISISCPTPMLVEFNRLVDVDKITQDLGNKNLVLKIISYNPDNIERVTYDIDPQGEMQLVVIPKPAQKPPTKDQIQTTYSGVSADTVILVGGMNQSHFPALSTQELKESKLMHIGTHQLNVDSKEILSFAKPASSISEIVSNLLKDGEIEITQDLATNLLLGIQEGSKNFSHREVNADTFKLAAQLMEKGAKITPPAPKPSFPKPSMPQFNKKPGFDIKPLERPQGETTNPQPTPNPSWTRPPKILKSSTI